MPLIWMFPPLFNIIILWWIAYNKYEAPFQKKNQKLLELETERKIEKTYEDEDFLYGEGLST